MHKVVNVVEDNPVALNGALLALERLNLHTLKNWLCVGITTVEHGATSVRAGVALRFVSRLTSELLYLCAVPFCRWYRGLVSWISSL